MAVHDCVVQAVVLGNDCPGRKPKVKIFKVVIGLLYSCGQLYTTLLFS